MSATRSDKIAILMYHSISDRGGPASISPEIFRRQMDVLEASGVPVISLNEVADRLKDQTFHAPLSVAITFDDAFVDFYTTALPELAVRCWPSTVFVPTGKVGCENDWDPPGSGTAGTPIMTWDQIREAYRLGVDFGAHAVTHRPLNALHHQEAVAEIESSQRVLSEELGYKVETFAAPFGEMNAKLEAEVARRFRLAVGTALGETTLASSLARLPRIDMYYFTRIDRWRSLLEGRAQGYLALRRVLRAVRRGALLLGVSAHSRRSMA